MSDDQTIEGLPAAWRPIVDLFLPELRGVRAEVAGLRESTGTELRQLRADTAEEFRVLREFATQIPGINRRLDISNGRLSKAEAQIEGLTAAQRTAREAEIRAAGEADGERRAYRRFFSFLKWVRRDGVVLKLGFALVVVLQFVLGLGPELLRRIT